MTIEIEMARTIAVLKAMLEQYRSNIPQPALRVFESCTDKRIAWCERTAAGMRGL